MSTIRMTPESRLQRSRSGGSTDNSQKSENNSEGSSTNGDGSIHSALSKFWDSVSNDSTPPMNGTTDVATPSQPRGQHVQHQTSTGNRKRGRLRLHILMYQAALKGDWQAAQILLGEDPNVACVKITERGDTALHVATITKHTRFVRKLVKRMNPGDLLLENDFGHTAFCYAAASGVVEIAALMREKNQNLIPSRGNDSMTPIYMAALLGNTDMVSYLYQFTPVEKWTAQEQFDLLLAAIEKNMYDVALKILRNSESLATMTNDNKTALHLLAEHDISDISTCQEAFLESLVSMFSAIPCLSWLKRIFEKPLLRKRAWLLAEKLLAEIQTSERANVLNDPPILHDAAKVGNVGFITLLTRSDPDLILKFDSKGHTIFHIAVIHRQEKVFNLIHQIGAMKNWIAMGKAEEGDNNILHLAGELAPESRLKIVAGAALQMQREMMWFKGVEKIAPASCLKMENSEGFLPRKLFSERHKQLLAHGETCMKETANSCMLTATLIATVVFAAAFTLPGGNNDDTGSPVLLKRSLFTVFVVSDVAAMFFSTFSIIMFLSILTSRFQEDDFLVSLPGELIFGLTALFASIVSTIVAFTSTCFLLFTERSTWIPILVAAFACFSLAFIFVLLHFKLWIDTIRSTYCSSFLFRTSKHSLF